MLPVVHRDTVPVDDRPARRDATVMSLPEKVLDVDRRLPASLVDEADCEDLGPVSVPVNVQLGFECVLMHQSYVSLVQYGVLRLTIVLVVLVYCQQQGVFWYHGIID